MSRRLRVHRALVALAGAALLAPSAHAASTATPTVHTVSADAGESALAVSPSGEAIVTYTGTSTAQAAFVRRLAPSGTLGPALRVSEDGERTVNPKVVLAADGRAFVAWRSGIASPLAARGRWVAADGTRGPVLTLAPAQDTGQVTDRDVTSLGLVLADDGRVTVTFRNDDQSATDSGDMGLRRVTTSGGLAPAAGPLSGLTLGSFVVDPVVAPLPGGGTVFAWRGNGTDAVVVGPSEVLPAAVTDVSVSGSSAGPRIAVDATGRTTVAWRRGEAAQWAVTARRLDAAGLPIGTVFDPSPLAAPFVRIQTPVVVNPAGEALVGWTRQPVNDAAFTIRSRTAAGVLGAVENVFSDAAQDVRTWDLAADGLGNAYAAWSMEDVANQDTVVVQSLTFGGTSSGPQQILDVGPVSNLVGLGFGADGVGATLIQQPGTTSPVLLRQLIPPPGGCTDARTATAAGASVVIPVTCTGVQARAQVTSTPAGGSASDAGGPISYTPRPGFSGTDTFSVRAVNAAGVTGGAAVVTVQVAPGPVAPQGTVDRTAPVVSRVSVSNRRFRAGGGGAQAAAKRQARRAPAGTRLRFTLSEAATVRVSVQRSRPGRRSGTRCVTPTKRNAKARRCTLRLASGVITRSAQPAGARSISFSGRRRGKALPAGSYRATIVATDAAGNASRPVSASFTIVAR